MDLELINKVALVTAASRGLGYACAMALAAEGANVAICSRSKTRVRAAASRISKATGSEVIGVQADLTREDQLPLLVREVEKVFGPIDIFVFNTGNPPAGDFTSASDKDWALGFSLCLRPPIVLCRLILPKMRMRKFGRIIFLSSIFAQEPDKGYVVSSTFRAGLGALSKCLGREAGQDGVSVNLVCPGYFDTPLLHELARKHAKTLGKSSERVLSDWGKLSPARRLGSPAHLGALVALLASSQGSYIQGAAVPIDGGALHGL